MSAPPLELPEWATDGGAQVTTPSLGFRQTGYVPGTAAGAGVMNWYKNLVYQWLQWVKFDLGAAKAEANELVASSVTASTLLTAPDLMNGFTALPIASPAGRIIGVGAGGAIKYSDNGGSSWSNGTAGSGYTLEFFDVQYFNGPGLIAVGTNGEIQKSSLGVTWTHKTTGTSNELRAIAYNGSSHLIAVGGSGTSLVSTDDGETWSAGGSINSGDFFPHSLTYANGTWLVGGNSTVPSRDTTIFRSTNNGATWTPVVLSSGPALVVGETCGGVAQVQGRFVAHIASVSNPARTIVSDNGTTWLSGGDTLAGSGAMVLACGTHLMALTPRDTFGRGVMSYDCGQTWFPLMQPGFGGIHRMQMLTWSSTVSGTRKWIACGGNPAAVDQGKAIHSRFFAV